MSEKHEKHPWSGPEQSQPEPDSERPQASAHELGGLGLAAASQPDEVPDMVSSPKRGLRASTTAAFRLSHENRRQLREPTKPEQPPEKPAPWGKDLHLPMRRGGGESNS